MLITRYNIWMRLSCSWIGTVRTSRKSSLAPLHTKQTSTPPSPGFTEDWLWTTSSRTTSKESNVTTTLPIVDLTIHSGTGWNAFHVQTLTLFSAWARANASHAHQEHPTNNPLRPACPQAKLTTNPTQKLYQNYWLQTKLHKMQYKTTWTLVKYPRFRIKKMLSQTRKEFNVLLKNHSWMELNVFHVQICSISWLINVYLVRKDSQFIQILTSVNLLNL